MKPEEILSIPESRYCLLKTMSLDEAKDLLRFLSISSEGDCFNTLQRICIKPTELQLEKIYKYFSLHFTRENKIEDDQNLQPCSIEEIKPEYSLFPHQREIFKKITKSLDQNGYSRVLLHMPTGSGKTRTAMSIVCEHLRRKDNGLVIWLADSTELCDQAIREFSRTWRHLGDRPIKRYYYCGGSTVNLDKINTGFLAITLQSLNSLIKSKNQDYAAIRHLASKKPFVVFDEAHKAIAPTYKQLIDFLSPKGDTTAKVLGLTATPGRSNELEARKLSEEFEYNKITLRIPGYSSPISYLQDEGYLARPIFSFVKHAFDLPSFLKTTGKSDLNDFSAKELNDLIAYLANDKERNLLVLMEIKRLIDKGNKRIIVFAASVEQAERLSFILKYLKINSKSLTTLHSNNRKKVVDWYTSPVNVAKDARVLLNYNILTAGFDAPETTAVFIARPTTSIVLYSQMVGRGLRGPRAGGNSSSEIVTVVDENIPAFRNIELAFENWEANWI